MPVDADHVADAVDEVEAGQRGAEPAHEHGALRAQHQADAGGVDLRGQAGREGRAARQPGRSRERLELTRHVVRGQQHRRLAAEGPLPLGLVVPARVADLRRVRQDGDPLCVHLLAGGELGVGLDAERVAAEPERQLALRLGQRVERVEVPDDAPVLRLEVDGVAPLGRQRPQERQVGPALEHHVHVRVGARRRRLDLRREPVGAEDRLGDPARGAGPGDDLLLQVEPSVRSIA